MLQLHGADVKKKEVLAGVCHVWGTMKVLAVPTVIRSITRLTDVGSNIQVKRKYKTNNDGKIARWWYILHAEEAQLKQLEQEWERVHLQTSWKLEPCYKHPLTPSHQETVPAAEEQPPSQAVLDNNSTATSHGAIEPAKELEAVGSRRI